MDRYLLSPRLNPSPTIEILVGKHDAQFVLPSFQGGIYLYRQTGPSR